MQLHESKLWPAQRHEELIAEARRLHEAARAVRVARDEGGRLALGRSTAQHHAPERRLSTISSPPSRRTTWRSAAWHMGHSLVTVGQRLERLGDSD